MPRRKRVNRRRVELTDQQIAWLNGDDDGSEFFYFHDRDELRLFWIAHGERVTAEHVAENPGTRPRRWWQYDSPEPRRRIGGIGSACHECLAYVPNYDFGIPTSWVTQWMVDYYTGRARDIHGNLTNPKPSGTFRGVALDPNDPPTYESEASYLERLGLFFPGEKTRLTKTDFEPEAVT
jgi:hypothetical protein